MLKILIAPALIGAASLAGRRWGPAVSGWLVGLPLTSAPVAFLLALDHGPTFAATVALGTLAGTISQVLFAVVYARLAPRCSWPWAAAGGSLVFAACTVLLRFTDVALAPLALLVMVVLALALWLTPEPGADAREQTPLPRWDLPVRMMAATAIVAALTTLAPALGPQLTGLLTPFPVYAAILTVFAHRLQGPAAAVGVMRGLLAGLFGFTGFFVVVASVIEQVGIATAFVTATAVALTVQFTALHLLRRPSK